jgi:hypothetical protein
MRRSVGLGIGAVVLSITVGVLVGLVIHTGMTQRAGDPVASTTSTRASVPSSSGLLGDATSLPDAPADPVDPGPSGASEPWLRSLAPVTEASGADPTRSTVTETVTESPATSTTATGSTTRAAHSTTSPSPTVAPSTTPRSTRVTATSTSVLRTTVSTRSGTSDTITADPGHDSPDGPCGTLGEKSSTSDGATLYCQHDQQDGSLRWRAVTNGGGCLNRTMTGTGLDGQQYDCRRSTNGLNYWRPAR